MLHKSPVLWRVNSQGGGQFNGHVTEVGSLMEREWSFYGGGQQWRENGHITEVASLNVGE